MNQIKEKCSLAEKATAGMAPVAHQACLTYNFLSNYLRLQFADVIKYIFYIKSGENFQIYQIHGVKCHMSHAKFEIQQEISADF